MKRIFLVENCDRCPNFDNDEPTYESTCMLLRRTIKYDRLICCRTIPEDCPLEKYK